MQNFRLFTEKKTYTLSSKDEKQVEKILQNYNAFFNPVTVGDNPEKKLSKNKLYNKKERTFFLGTIKYHDPILNDEGIVSVVVNFEPNISARGAYIHDTNTIELFYVIFNNLSENLKRNTIAHELFHAKQHYRKISPEARRAVHKRTLDDGAVTIRSKRGYYFSQNELPVQLASIVYELERQYNLILKHIKTGKNAKFWERQRGSFLQLLERFLRERSIKNFPLPSYLHDQQDFIETLFRNKNNPKYAKTYKNFKIKLHFTYDKLRKLKAPNINEPEIKTSVSKS